MRYLLFAFACMLTFACRAQKNKFPYQILDCKNLTDDRGKLLKRFDLLDAKYKYRIADGGYCLLVHLTGEVVEMTSDTSFTVADLPSDFVGTGDFESRPDIRALFEHPRYTYMESISSYGDHETFLFPSRRRIMFGKDDDLCIRLKPHDAPQHHITVKDLFGDTLRTFTVDKMELHFTNAEFRKIVGDNQMVIVEDHLNNKIVSTLEIKINWLKPAKSFYRCRTDAFQLAMAAHDFEFCSEHNEAAQYFTAAAQQSSFPVFKEMLRNFELRQAKRKKS